MEIVASKQGTRVVKERSTRKQERLNKQQRERIMKGKKEKKEMVTNVSGWWGQSKEKS